MVDRRADLTPNVAATYPDRNISDTRHQTDHDILREAVQDETTPFVSQVTGADDTGVADAAPTLQGAFDATRHLILPPGGTYLLDSAIFLDDATDLHTPYVLDCAGSTLLLGAGLPTASPFLEAPATGWALHVNTLRSALAGGVVTHSDATRASGSGYPPKPRLIVRDAVIDGNDQTAGFAYANTSAVTFENCIFRRLTFALSWRGYSDGSTVDGGQVVAQPSGGWLVVQETNGDAITIRGVKGMAGIWKAQQCLSGRVTDCIGGGVALTKCKNIVIDAPHVELDEPGGFGSMLWLSGSQVTVRDGYWQCATTAGKYVIEIADDPGDPLSHTDLLLDHCASVFHLSGTDPVRAEDVRVTSLNADGRLRVRNHKGYAYAAGTLPTNPGGGMFVTSADPTVTAALTTAGPLLAADFDLQAYSGGWEVVGPSPLNGVLVGRRHTVPTITLDTTLTVAGTLTPGQSYQYQAAMIDLTGRVSAASSTQSGAAPASGTIGVDLAGQTAPATVRVWRSASATVTTAPDFYCDVPLASPSTELFDTGAHLNGYPWLTAGTQTPQNNAAVNHTFEHLQWRINGVLWGQGAGSPEGAVTAPVGSMWSRDDGGAASSLYVKESGTGSTGWVAK